MKKMFFLIFVIATMTPIILGTMVLLMVMLIFIPIAFWVIPLILPIIFCEILMILSIASIIRNNLNNLKLLRIAKLSFNQWYTAFMIISFIYLAVTVTLVIIRSDIVSNNKEFTIIPFAVIFLNMLLIYLYIRSGWKKSELL